MNEHYEDIVSNGKVVGQVLVSDAPAKTKEQQASDAAIIELANIDRSTGMSRLLRESLMALLGASAPATLKAVETSAAAARAKIIP